MPLPTKDQVDDALRAVIDPELRRSIVDLGMVRSIEIADSGQVDVIVSLTTAGCPIRNHFGSPSRAAQNVRARRRDRGWRDLRRPLQRQLRRVPDGAESEPGERVARGERSDRGGGAARGRDQRPENRRAEGEPDREQGADRRATLVGELAEHRHRPRRRRRGAEAPRCSRRVSSRRILAEELFKSDSDCYP